MELRVCSCFLKMEKLDKKIREKYESICKEFKIDSQLLDIEMIWDSILTSEENWSIITEMIKALASSKEIENKVKVTGTKKNIKAEKEAIAKSELDGLKKTEELAKETLNKALENIVNDKKTNLDKYFKPLKEYIKAVVNSDGYLNSLFVHSLGGLGKTTICLATLKELEKSFVYISSYTTIVEFVNFLYENSNKIIVMDDMEEMLKLGSKMISVCKSAMWGIGKENKRLITYLTTSKLMKAPRQFEFKGKLIFLLNKLPNEQDILIKALLSRSIVCSLNFTYSEMLEILAEFSKIPYKTLTEEKRKEIFEYLKENADESVDLNFRTILKIYDLCLNNENWRELSKIFFKKDSKLVLLKQFLKESSTIKEVQEKWCEETGFSRASFFREKNRLNKKNETNT